LGDLKGGCSQKIKGISTSRCASSFSSFIGI
jgi:hypothetical protein